MAFEAQSIFKVMQPAMIALFIINAQRAFIKIIADVNELPTEMKNYNFPIMLNDEDFSMMIDSVPANPVEDGGVTVARMLNSRSPNCARAHTHRQVRAL
jgi:hypothetical protein